MQAVYRPRKDTLFKTKIGKIDILIKTKTDKIEKHTLAGRTSPLSHYKGVPPPGLELIWPISSLKISKMSKKCVSGKKLWELIGWTSLNVISAADLVNKVAIERAITQQHIDQTNRRFRSLYPSCPFYGQHRTRFSWTHHLKETFNWLNKLPQ